VHALRLVEPRLLREEADLDAVRGPDLAVELGVGVPGIGAEMLARDVEEAAGAGAVADATAVADLNHRPVAAISYP
jgi:hypothetical protein